MKKTFEKELPSGYKKVYSIDLKDKKTGIIYTILAIIPITVLTPIIYLTLHFELNGDLFLFDVAFLLMFLFSFSVWFVILALHYLFEGIACKIVHNQKATLLSRQHQIGHGILNVYIHKKAILLEILIPHIIFGIMYLTAIIFSFSIWPPFILYIPLFILSMHIWSCVSDIHILYALLFICKGKNALYMDNGQTISFYTKT